MASPVVPNTTFRPIQVEETTGKNPLSEFLTQGIAGNNNYLKAQNDNLLALIAAYFASGAISLGQVFIPAGSTTLASPNGKQWFLVFMTYEFNGNIQNEQRAVMQGQTTHFVTTFANSGLTASLSGSNIVTAGGWPHEWSGWGLYQT